LAKRSSDINGSPDSRRRLTAALVLAGVCVLPIACGNSNTSHPSARPSIAEVPLDRLLLSPAEVNTAMGGTEMTVSGTFARMNDDSAKVADANCRAISDVAEASVYAGSRWNAVVGQELTDRGRRYPHGVVQAVVSFPTADDADRFYAASSQRWPACSNRKYTETGSGQLRQVWKVGPISDTSGMLSTTETTLMEGDFIWSCARALTIRSNIAVDVLACSYNATDQAAVSIAHQITAKVAAR
jgi:serine/threonine-protein kinase